MTTDINNPSIQLNQKIAGFRVSKINHLPVLENIIYQLEHESTGAKLIHLSNADDNNCFAVAFKTTPKDSTGVAHILEHTALCGSKQFPVRDPFFSMIKRSMKTFMNAFTAADWTMYPFSTQNEKDFFNLMRVYLDAAFFPLLTEESFWQEGHRLEFSESESSSSDLTIQGIVYNEMKGAMSSQAHLMHDFTTRSLFPNITYRFNSGGDPEEIANLTHDQLISFHKEYYHPSNAYFYTYGNIPLEKNLEFIEEKVLSQFTRIRTNSDVPSETRFKKPKSFRYSYPLNEQDNDGQKCQIALAWLTCKIDEPLEVLSLQLINLILLGHSGAPLRKVLIESGLGKALADTTGFDDEIKEPIFGVGLQGVAKENTDLVEELILKTMQNIVKDGISDEQIDSAIHQIELDTREISGGHYPYSLNLLFRFFGTWIHEGDPLSSLDFDKTLSDLRNKLNKGPFLEQQIKKYLLDNPHRVKVTLIPDTELEEKQAVDFADKMEQLKASLTILEKENITKNSKQLNNLQGLKEDLSSLPSLKVSDIPKEIKYIEPKKKGLEQKDVTFYEQPTNGIAYLSWYFAIDKLSDEDRIWLPLLSYLLTNTGAGNLTYEEMANKISLYTGGFSSTPSIEKIIGQENTYKEYFVVSGKALNRNLEQLFQIAELLMGPRNFNEEDHIQNLMAQRTNGLVNSVVQAGHNYASSLACRNFGRSSYIDEIYSGIHQIKFMKMLAEQVPKNFSFVINKLKSLTTLLINQNNLSVLVTGDDKALSQTEPLITNLYSQLKQIPAQLSDTPDISLEGIMPEPISKAETWCTTTPVSYVAKAFKTIPYAHKDSAPLYVLSNLLKSCYLHSEIREKGGAYGAMSGYNADEGIFTMVSYRDPHLAKTLSVYENAFEWLSSGSFTERDVEETILQTCSSMDTPVSPAAKAGIEYLSARKGKTKEIREAFREGVLATSKKDLIRVGKEHLGQIYSISAVTSETQVDKDEKTLPSFQKHKI